MITGGNVTVFVSDMDRAVEFYSEKLGLNLEFRAGDHWAQINAGPGLVIGLHPVSPSAGPPGARGAVQIGLSVNDIVSALDALAKKGVEAIGEILDDPSGGVKIAYLHDPDGNALYLCESKW